MRILVLLVAVVIPFSDVVAQRKIRPVPTELTRACGTGVKWRTDLDAALAEAKAKKRPVFWYVPTVQRSRMDRKPEIDGYMMAGPFSAPDVETILNRKFIPVKLAARGEAQKKYGLYPLKFVEPGFLVLAPDGEEIKKVDKIATLVSEWFVWQLDEALSRRPALARESTEAAVAAKEQNPIALVRALLAEGDLEQAEKVAMKDAGVAKPTAEMMVLRARVFRRQRKEGEARKWMKAFEDPGATWTADVLVETMRLALARNLPKDAEAAFIRGTEYATNETRFLHSVALHLQNREGEAQEIWKKLVATGENDRWTRKASAELQRLGPFCRAFERFDFLPLDAFVRDPDGTRVGRKLKQGIWLGKRGIELLLVNQRANGSWDDSTYDFGGTASLPNVYLAITALAGVALMEWRDVHPAGVDPAVERAADFLLNEQNLAPKDRNEIAWAHAYRLIFFEHYLRNPAAKKKAAARTKARALVKELVDSQLSSGAWRHEYANPFVTATIIHALARAKRARVPTGQDTLEQAGKSLLQRRGQDGTFSYGQRGRAGSAPQAAAGRMPLCELALLLTGKSDQQKLAHAVETSFKHHDLLDTVRKYDDHADRYHNGGFFFWYDMYGRLEAIAAVEDTAKRKVFTQQMLQLVLDLPEIDGGFIDSHEIGKTYGTAMGMICLKALLPSRN
ncbi:MAG: hypothetical protein CMJ83_05345 [Planctomycetes bacterium]|nr:hypothetical protein [Planctomycetota bacterium]